MLGMLGRVTTCFEISLPVRDMLGERSAIVVAIGFGRDIDQSFATLIDELLQFVGAPPGFAFVGAAAFLAPPPVLVEVKDGIR